MKRFPALLLAAAVIGSLAAAPNTAVAQDQLVDNLSSIEKSLWDGWRNHDTKPFEKHLLDGALVIGGWGVEAGKQTALNEVANHDCEIESVSFSDWTAHQMSENMVMLTYSANQDGMCEGERIPEELVVASTYVRQGGSWMVASYHETPIHRHD